MIKRNAATETYILSQIADGKSLKEACGEVDVSRATFWEWCDGDAVLADRYARAREAQLRALADNLTAMPPPRDAVEASWRRLQADNIRWLLARLDARYADRSKTEITGANGGPIQQQTTVVHQDQVSAALDAVLPPEQRRPAASKH